MVVELLSLRKSSFGGPEGQAVTSPVDDGSPLNDPDFEPGHPPVDGMIPDVVRRWGKPSQLRWFNRYRRKLATGQDVTGLSVSSEHHLGWCCWTCVVEDEEGRGVIMDGYCCCRDGRIGSRSI